MKSTLQLYLSGLIQHCGIYFMLVPYYEQSRLHSFHAAIKVFPCGTGRSRLSVQPPAKGK